MEKRKDWYVYFIQDSNWFVKIWKTINIKNRTKKYITENANEIKLINKIYYNDYNKAEIMWHEFFENQRHNRERYKLNETDIRFISDMWTWDDPFRLFREYHWLYKDMSYDTV